MTRAIGFNGFGEFKPSVMIKKMANPYSSTKLIDVGYAPKP